jgi:hypothetical protein
VSLEAYARPHVEDMKAFDALPADIRAELRRTGEETRSYLKRTRRPWWKF